MASPTNFAGSNCVYGPPDGIAEEQCQTIFARQDQTETELGLRVVTCWKLTQEELDEINRTGNVWVGMFGGLASHFITGLKPF